MNSKFINVGFGTFVSSGRIISVVHPESAPIKRMIQDAKERSTLIDATLGRKTRSVIIMDSEHVILAPVQPETISQRLESKGEQLTEG